MKITYTDTRNYKPFDAPEFKRVSITPTTDVQLIVGTNGSAKSKLLETIIPSGVRKALFEKNGLRELHIDHEGASYTLKTDFGNKAQQFSFMKGDEELNISGLVSQQDELTVSELGFTQLIENLTTNKIRFSSMNKSERKNHILNINPFDLTYFSDLHKKTCSKIRECNNNIKMLHQRQAEIETKLADKTIVELKTSERQKLLDLKSALDRVIFTVGQYIKQYNTALDQLPNDILDLDEVSEYGRRVQRFLLATVDTDTSIRVSLEEIEFLSNEISDLERGQLWELAQEIDSYEAQLTELSKTEKISGSEIEKKIIEYTKELESLKGDDTLPSLRDTMSLDTFDDTIGQIGIELEHLSGYSISKFITEQVEHKLLNAIRLAVSELDSITSRELDLNIRLDKTLMKIKNAPSSPTGNDLCITCDLFKVNSTLLEELNVEKVNLQKELNKVEMSKHKLEQKIIKFKSYAQDHVRPSRAFRQIRRHLSSSNIFTTDWLDNTLPDLLIKQPLRLLTILDIVKSNTVNERRRTILQSELTELVTTLDKFKVANKSSREFFVKILEDKQTLYKTTSDKVDSHKHRLKHLQGYAKISSDREKIKNTLTKYKGSLKLKEEQAEMTAIKLYYEKVQEWCIQVQQSIDTDLRELEVFLNEQNSLKDRHENEIVPLVKTAEYERSVHIELELALSPTKGIPQKYLVKSINNYIAIANSLIAQVWTYPLVLELLDESEDLDFVFKVKARNHLVPDISDCSTGQQGIINFAWNIASLIGQKKYGYPLFLDEVGDGFDITHKQKFLELLRTLLDNKIISQIIMVNHHALMVEGFATSDVICMCDENIVVPEHANKCVVFE